MILVTFYKYGTGMCNVHMSGHLHFLYKKAHNLLLCSKQFSPINLYLRVRMMLQTHCVDPRSKITWT